MKCGVEVETREEQSRERGLDDNYNNPIVMTTMVSDDDET